MKKLIRTGTAVILLACLGAIAVQARAPKKPARSIASSWPGVWNGNWTVSPLVNGFWPSDAWTPRRPSRGLSSPWDPYATASILNAPSGSVTLAAGGVAAADQGDGLTSSSEPLFNPDTVINSSWKGGTGNWNVAADWSPSGVPNNSGGNTYNVTIDSGGTDLVTLNISPTIASLVLGGSTGTSTVQNLANTAETLTVTGATTINTTGALIFGNSSILKFEGGLTVDGTYDLQLNGATATVTGSALINSGGGGIVGGAGVLTVNGTLTNSGVLYTGYVYGGGNTVTVNGGLANNGSLTMYGSTYGGTADMLNVSGALTNNAGASLYLYDESSDVANTASLSNSGTVYIGDGAILNLTASGTDTNTGTITLGNAVGGTLEISASAVTLSGSGTLTMSNVAGNVITAAAPTDVLTNASTIEGSGNIGNGAMGFVNTGTVLANQSTALIIDPSSTGFNNQGTLNVSTGDTLKITGPANSFLNYSSATDTLTGGTYLVSGTLQFGATGNTITTNDASITLSGSGAKIITPSGGNMIAPLSTNDAGAVFDVTGGYNFTTAGNFTNNGTLTVGSSNSKFIVKSGSSLTNFSGTTLTGGTYLVSGTLEFGASGSSITTDDANITLSGASAQIINFGNQNMLTSLNTIGSGSGFGIQSGANFTTAGTFTNNGTVTVGSGSTFGVGGFTYTNTGTTTIQTGGTMDPGTIINSHTFTNQGTLEASAGGTLTLQGGTFTNTGGTILATGTNSQVVLNGSTITGGTLTSSSGGVIVGENNAVLNGSTGAVTISTGSTVEVLNGQTLDAKGTLTNNGTVTLNASSSNTELLLTTNTTLSGTGKVTLSANADNLIGGSSSSVVLTNNETIQGGGSIGSVATPIGVLNKKTITANTTTPLIINASTSGLDVSSTGTLSVSTGDTMEINGTFTNYASNTLTGGAYTVSGTLDLPSGDTITTNAATITLTGAAAEIRNPAGSGSNALAALASNASTGKLTLASGQNLSDSATAFTNAGTLTIKSGSKLNLTAATATYTQSAGTTTVDGNLTAKGGITFNGGSVFGKSGTLNVGATGTVTDNATFNIGDTVMTAAKETVSGMYSQTSTGALNIDIGGTTADTQYDQLIVSGAASLNGILNLDLINGFVPTLTDTFEILTTSALTGTFLTVNGTSINSNEHFGVVYNATNVTLDVLSGPAGGGAWGGDSELLASSGEFGSGSGNGSPINPSSTPEPGSLVLLGSGLFGLGSYARRKMKR